MNKIEQLVYNAVKGNPGIKRNIRNAYQSFYDLLPKQKDYSKNQIEVCESFYFGFHDISPFSKNDERLLANRLTIPFRAPKKGELLDIGYFPTDNFTPDFYTKLGDTKTWNYHKGCRLQWLGNTSVIYNDLVANVTGAVICNVQDKTKRKINFPVDSVSPDGKYATSFSYERLERLMPGYGYAYEDDSFISDPIPLDTGMFIVDLEKNSRDLICNMRDLVALKEIEQQSGDYYHFVTHSLFSHDSRYISFLHRWTTLDNVAKRFSRLIVYDRKLKSFSVSPTTGMVSHYVWNSKHQIIAYCQTNYVDSHVLFENPTMEKYRRIAYPRLNSDGHQSFISDVSFVSDTYPDKYRMANLFKVDCLSNEVELLARLNSPKKFQSAKICHWSCDLHPRMNHKGDTVCFDSVHTGARALCLMKI